MSDRKGEPMREVDHTHPYTRRTFGETVAFERGPAVAADGGEPDADPSDRGDEGDEGDEKMRDVDHTPPEGDGANRVFERGTEGRDETV
ncbi:hypothetical protein BRC83_08485 [Halobacteriales archaeon QS_1_68_17]|nr:MAG: hypothetical protein BRC83_08485 [Halobacteriales archaeon QS_1_68_17]